MGLRKHFLGYAVVALLVVVAGCGRDTQFIYNQVEEPPELFSGIHKLKELQGESKVDILFVVDNSGSMGSYQQALIKNADQFINDFVKHGGLDWKMGLLSTDVMNNPFIGFTPTTELSVRTPDNVRLFKDAVGRLGTAGDAIERSFAPVQKWIPKHPTFLRPNAMLALIFVTDAEEQSGVKAQDFIDFLTVTKTSLKKVVTYGVFAAQDLGCTVGDSTWKYAGSPYEPVITATTGKVYPLCKDFGTNLADLGKDLYTRVARPSIRLKSRPQLSTLSVNYLGAVLPGGPVEDGGYWIYDFDLNAIMFHSLDFAPGENEEVEIVYEIAT
jgi:hypothetical protein